MDLMHEELARAQMSARLGEAHHRRQGHQLLLARRLGRKAEEAAHRRVSPSLARCDRLDPVARGTTAQPG